MIYDIDVLSEGFALHSRAPALKGCSSQLLHRRELLHRRLSRVTPSRGFFQEGVGGRKDAFLISLLFRPALALVLVLASLVFLLHLLLLNVPLPRALAHPAIPF